MTIQQLKTEAHEMKVMESHGKSLIIRPIIRKSFIKDPDFCKTGHALCGVLYPQQTLDQFKKEWVERQYSIHQMYATDKPKKKTKKRK